MLHLSTAGKLPRGQCSPLGSHEWWQNCRAPEMEKGHRHAGLGRQKALCGQLAVFQSEEHIVGELLNESGATAEVISADNSSASERRTQWTSREFKLSGN